MIRSGWCVALVLGGLTACGGRTAEKPATAPSAAEHGPSSHSASPEARVEHRVDELLSRMTLEEKIDYLGGDREFFVRAVPRLGIPAVKMSDGPQGCRNWGPSTAYPSPVGWAASFDAELGRAIGEAMGRDCRARGVGILLAPGVNIHRSPKNGRNFEYFGEDPWLAGEMAVQFTRGVQSQGVVATVKHYVANNRETERDTVSSDVDERALREIYFPAFERVVKEADVGAVMTSYNLVNGTYASHHHELIEGVLRRQWGFSGLVMSDWAAVHETKAAFLAGLDLEMPAGTFFNRATLVPLLERGEITPAALDDKVRHILRVLVGAGLIPLDAADASAANVSGATSVGGANASAVASAQEKSELDDEKSRTVARRAAERSLVLLENRGVLPLDVKQVKKLAVIGPNAHPAVTGGSGSAYVTPFHAVSVLDGIRAAAPGVEVVTHPGLARPSSTALLAKSCFSGDVKRQVFSGTKLEGAPIEERNVDRVDYRSDATPPTESESLPKKDLSIRWSGTFVAPKRGTYEFVSQADDGMRVFIDGVKQFDDWTEHAPRFASRSLTLDKGKHAVVVEYFQGGGGAVAQFGMGERVLATSTDAPALEATLKDVDVAVVVVGFGQFTESNSTRAAFGPFWPPSWARDDQLVEAEASDRSFELPAAQLDTIELALRVAQKVVVVLEAGAPVDVERFASRVGALLVAWYPGQEGGAAVADVLWGKTSPSGKLPVTFARRYDDYPSAKYFDAVQDHRLAYGEGVFVGYRGFDASEIEPRYPFGFGLSYSKFEYESLIVTNHGDGNVDVQLRVRNVGARAAREVVQVYVAPPAGSVSRPPQELRAFASVELGAGATGEVRLDLLPRAFARFDAGLQRWVIDAGRYEVRVASSSRDVRAHQSVTQKAAQWEP